MANSGSFSSSDTPGCNSGAGTKGVGVGSAIGCGCVLSESVAGADGASDSTSATGAGGTWDSTGVATSPHATKRNAASVSAIAAITVL